ncbi:MAG: addiction module protein [Coprothermobacterota bacterium]|nr:addiction module protein [Coprothermobacterota bacterium]
MEAALPLDQMTIDEKLRALERIWADLCRVEMAVPSPLWHRDVLQAREARLLNDQEQFTNWEEAKKRIRDFVK